MDYEVTTVLERIRGYVGNDEAVREFLQVAMDVLNRGEFCIEQMSIGLSAAYLPEEDEETESDDNDFSD